MAKNGNIHPTRIFKTPEELEAAFELFKEDLIEQGKEWMNVQYVGKDANRVSDPMKVPMTLEGFKRFCRTNYGDVQNYFDNYDGLYGDFTVICSRIREEIRENQIIGGLLGVYNASITQRLNGLSDKQEIKAEVKADVTTEAKIDLSKLSLEEKITLRDLQKKVRGDDSGGTTID
ncbi:terminase small subunit [Sphingobacterium multivorum]|uniref:terminase small subunit n=1 Tax=Sphingobacterium multivorum TaxID=28454 RepID=UPI0031BB7BBA